MLPDSTPAIRAAVKAAILKYKWKVIGIPDGFDGLIWPERLANSQGSERVTVDSLNPPPGAAFGLISAFAFVVHSCGLYVSSPGDL